MSTSVKSVILYYRRASREFLANENQFIQLYNKYYYGKHFNSILTCFVVDIYLFNYFFENKSSILGMIMYLW